MADWQGMRASQVIVDEMQDYYERSRMNLGGFLKDTMVVPEFRSQEQADEWLTKMDTVPRQLYPTGSHVVFWRDVEWYEVCGGLIVPTATVEFVGRVVAWREEWRLSTHTDKRPRYQLLTLDWKEQQPELVWVQDREIKGPLDG